VFVRTNDRVHSGRKTRRKAVNTVGKFKTAHIECKGSRDELLTQHSLRLLGESWKAESTGKSNAVGPKKRGKILKGKQGDVHSSL